MPLFKKAAVNGRPLVQLSDIHLRVLRRCRMILIKDLNPLDILDSLTPEDGFKQDVKDSILYLSSSDKQVGAILDHLETQSDDTFSSFMDILREQYRHLHRVLVETSRTLDEADDDQVRERAAIVGDSVRKLLRHTARRQMQDQLRRGSGESPGDYYIDDLKNDGDDVGQYIDCYIIPTRGRLQKEKWIKHVTVPQDRTTSPAVGLETPRTSSEVILTHDLDFRLIDRADIPKDIEQPPKMCTCIYTLKQKENEKTEEKTDAEKEFASNLYQKQKVTRMKRSNNCPPPLPPKPDILSLSGKNLMKSMSLPKGSLSDTEKVKDTLALDIIITPPLLVSKSEDDDSENKLTPSPSEPKIKDLSAPPLPLRKSQEKTEEAKQATSPCEERPKDAGEVRIMSTPPLPIRKPQSKSESADLATKTEAWSPPTPTKKKELSENGTKNKTELSGDEDDDDEEDALSLNFDVRIEDDDDDVVSPTESRDRGRTITSIPSLSIIRKGSDLSFSTLSPTTPVSDNLSLVSHNRNLSSDGKCAIGLDQSIPVDLLGSVEGSHYEEIEPRGESLSAGFYLDPRSDRTLNRQNTRQKEHRNGTSAYTLNQLKTLEAPRQLILAKGTLLIIKNKTEIKAPDAGFDKTFIGYDHMGFAYYVPIDSIRQYGDPRNEKWFYPIEMMAKEATLFLNSVNQKGCFVVYRPSRRHDPSVKYCLSVSLGNGVVLHYNIVENVHGDVMVENHDHSFMNICDLIEYFRKNQSSLATRLRRPLKEGSLPIMPGHNYSSHFEIPRHEITLSSVVVEKGLFSNYHLAAFKGISVKVSVMRTEPSATNDDDFLEEGLMMMMMEHENIIRFLGMCCSARPYCIVMEHVDRGTLNECLQQNVIPSDNIDSLFAICIQLVAAMNYLESLAFMLHRNLSAQSFFVTADLLVKLGKFDRARHVADDNYQAPSSEEVMVRWAAPEVLTGLTYSTKSDVWSLGVVFWEVFSQGACPYMPCGVEQVALYVVEGGKLDKPPGCAPDLWLMMKSCWKQSPSDRPTFAMLQDKIKGKSSIYYVSPVHSNLSDKNSAVIENGSVLSKSKLPQNRVTGSGGKSVPYMVSKHAAGGSASARKKRSQSANRGTHDRIEQNGKEVREKRANSAVRNSAERPRTPSSDSSSIISSVLNGSCDELDRGQKARKSWKKLLK